MLGDEDIIVAGMLLNPGLAGDLLWIEFESLKTASFFLFPRTSNETFVYKYSPYEV